MQNVLADLALESEAALALSLRMGQALEQLDDPQQAHFARLVTAVGKYWICKRAPAMINEAAECLGGAGYVEDSILPRLYREAPVNSTLGRLGQCAVPGCAAGLVQGTGRARCVVRRAG